MTTNSKIHIDASGQRDLFAELAELDRQDTPILTDATSTVERRFIAPDASKITIGNILLEEHLELTKQKSPFVLAQVLNGQDFTEFKQRYANRGRPPYSPKNMLGIILYGIMQGVSSLRGLERMARLDLGCMWVSGGITPDHANIGRFINMHSQSLTDPFFEAIVLTALTKTGSGLETLAGDGTVIEAACSQYKIYREEALRHMAEESQTQLDKTPQNKALQKTVGQLNDALAIIDVRNTKRKANNRQISLTEPESMLQKAKRGRGFWASYKPSVMANKQRIVVSSAVDPGSEIAVIPQMLKQAMKIGDNQTEERLLDAGYFAGEVIQATLQHDVSLLCPQKSLSKRIPKAKVFLKSQFRYDASTDSYICPAGEQLHFIKPRKATEIRKYGKAPCDDCPLKAQCTTPKNKEGRKILRYPEDDKKEALCEIMDHPQARASFSKRQGMVEPVFSHLRQVQGLNRFRRKGLAGVRTEFALHLLAYNISRILAYYSLKILLKWERICDIHKNIAIIAIAMKQSIFQQKNRNAQIRIS